MINSFDVYFDFISPYSYLAHKQIRNIENKEKIKINYKPILLGALHKLEGITPPAHIKLKSKYMIEDCKLIAKKLNIKFKFNSNFPISSLNLMRGILVIKNNLKDSFINNFFDAYWQEDLDVKDLTILNNILKKINIDIEEFHKQIEDQKIKNKLKELTQEAHDIGIFGAPTFYINKKIFWGQDRLKYALDEIMKKNEKKFF